MNHPRSTPQGEVLPDSNATDRDAPACTAPLLPSATDQGPGRDDRTEVPVIGGHMDGRTVAVRESNTWLHAPLLRSLTGMATEENTPLHKWRRTPTCFIHEGPMDPDPDPFPKRIRLFRRSR